MIDFDPIVTRKPPPKAQPPFHCAACRRDIQPSPWPYDAREKAPLCIGCVRHWGGGYGLKVSGTTYGDRLAMTKVAALFNLIEWEAHNGHHRTIR